MTHIYGNSKRIDRIDGDYIDNLKQFAFVEPEGDDKGVSILNGQLSVGCPACGSEFVAGQGDSYPVPYAFHCTTSDTSGLTIVNAEDVSEILQSDNSSTTGLFGGTTAGHYILVGSDYPYGGIKAKIDTLGTVEPANVQIEYLRDDLPTWVYSPHMATDANNINAQGSQKGWQIATCSSCSEQWRVGFDPTELPTVWNKVTLNINGENITKYWSRFRITSDITSDPIMQQAKLHTNRFEVNSDGSSEYFGRSRYEKTLFSGVQNLINNTAATPSNQDVTYDTGSTVADYSDNQFNDGVVDSALIPQAIPVGLDTSIPLLLSISYYVEGIGTGDVEWEADVYKIADGFLYDGNAEPVNFSVIDQVITPSNLERKTAVIKIFVNDLTDRDSILIKLKRDATAGNPDDTLPEAVVVTQVRLDGYFWRP